MYKKTGILTEHFSRDKDIALSFNFESEMHSDQDWESDDDKEIWDKFIIYEDSAGLKIWKFIHVICCLTSSYFFAYVAAFYHPDGFWWWGIEVFYEIVFLMDIIRNFLTEY